MRSFSVVVGDVLFFFFLKDKYKPESQIPIVASEDK